MADNIRVVIDADASQLERELRKAGVQVNTFGSQASGAGRGVSAFNAVADQQVRNLQQLGRVAMVAGQGIALAGGAVAAYSIKEGIQFNSTMESNRMALEQFLGSTQAADRFLNQLFETAKRGPFQFTQITEAARKLLAFEFTKGEATETLDAISDSVAALGGSADVIDRVVIAMGQIQAKGRVQGDELLQLAEAGIPAYQILRDELGLTADQVKNIGDAGITADQAIRALTDGMEDRFGGAAERQAKTFAGQMSTLQDNFQQMMGGMTEGLYSEMKEWLPVVNDTAEQIAAIWNRDDLTPEAKFRESRKAAEKNLGPLVDEIGRMVDRADLPEKFGDALSAVLPVAAEGAGQLGVAVAKGTVEGFLAADIWGKVLIGGWLFTKMGGVAAIRAAGAQAGQAAAGGFASGAVGAGAAGGAGGFLSKAAGFAAGAGKAGLWAAAITGGIEAADILVNNSADNIKARLEQIDRQGKGLLGTLDRDVFNKIVGPDEGSIASQGDAAHDLLKVLDEVNQVGDERARQLREQGRQMLENLDLTEKEKDAVNKILNLKPQAASDVQGGIDRLAGGLITRMGDIKKLMRENSREIADAWAGDPSGWRSATARNLNAAVAAIRAGMKAGVIEAGKGKAEIRRLLARRDLLTGADPVGLAQGFRKSWLRAGDINQSNIKRIIGQLDAMPRGARNKAAQTMLQMAKQLEKDKKLPEGAFSKLRSALLANLDVTVNQGRDRIKKLQDAAGEGGRAWSKALDGFGKGTEDGMRRTNRALDRGVRDAERAMDRLEKRAGDITAGVGGPFKRLPSPVGAGMSQVAGKVNQGLKAVGSDKSIDVAFAEGGMMRVAGQGLHDSVAVTGNDIRAMVAPGEDLVVLNRHQRPMVDAAVAQTYGVSGLGGFFNRYDRPHYMARGGIGPGSKKIDSPRLTGSPDAARDYGQGGLDMFTEAARKMLRREQAEAYAGPKGGSWSGGSGAYPGVSGDTDFMPALGMALSKMSKAAGQSIYVQSGWRSYAEQAALYQAYLNGTGNLAAPPGSSNHESGRAADITPGSEVFGGMASRFGLGFTVPGESWHIELLKRGGFIQSLAKGGVVKNPWFDPKTKKGNINGIWPSADLAKNPSGWYALPTLPGYVIGALAEAAGRHFGIDVPGRTMMQMVMGEGAGKPGSQGTDPGGRTKGYGLWAVTTTYNDALVKRFGGSYGAMNNPVLNAAAMAHIYRDQGTGAWYGDSHVSNFNADWRGKYQLRNALGGISYSQALKSALTGKPVEGGGESEKDQRKQERANRRKQREKQIKALTAKARNASTPSRKKALWWQVIEQYARFGDFDMPDAFTTASGGVGVRGFNEKAHLLSQAARISGIPNPNRGAGQLAQLAKWLEDHVDITGRESEDKGLVKRLAAFKDRGGDTAKKRRERIYKRMARYGTEFPWGKRLNASLDRLEISREWAEIAEGRATNAGGPGGSDYTDAEKDYLVRLYTSLLGEQVDQRKLIDSGLPKAFKRRSVLKNKIEAARKNPKLKWKIPGWKKGLSAINKAIEDMRENRETLVGVTGKGGEIFGTRMRLQELGATTTVEGARQNEINALLKEQLTETQRGYALGQAQYGVFRDFLSGMGMPFIGAFAMGTDGRRVGRTGLAVLHENEVVTPDPKGPYGLNMSTVSSGAAPVVEITVAGDVAPLLNRIDARIDGKTAQVVQKVNSQLGRERRQTAYAPGR